MRDTKDFRERFNRWKKGDKVYDAGRPLQGFGDGKDEYIPRDQWAVDPVTGNTQMSNGRHGAVVLPELTVRPNHIRSAFNGYDIWRPVHKALEGFDQLLGRGIQAVAGEKGAQAVGQYVFPYLSPSRYVGWATSGYAPHRPENPGLGREELNEMFDLGTGLGLYNTQQK